MDVYKAATSYEAFDTDAYYKTYRAPLTSTGTAQEYVKFILESLHEVFHTGSISGNRLLDVGTGGSLVSFLSASHYVKEIHLSDLLPSHLDLLKRWLEGEDRENDIVQYVIDRENNGTTCENRLSKLRRKVTKIKFIDVTKNPPLQELDGHYDIITSVSCLEVVCPCFRTSGKKCHNIAKAWWLYDSSRNASRKKFYVVGNIKFWNAGISEKDLKSALKAAGFTTVF